MKELTLRCYLARGQVRENATVIGITFIGGRQPAEIPPESCMICIEEWTPEDEVSADEARRATGYFSNQTVRCGHEDEFPRET